MPSRIKKIALILFPLVVFSLQFPQQAMAADWKGVCVAADDVATIQGLQCLVGNVLSIAVSGLGIVGFVMMIIGSFKYLLSGGNAKGTEEGKNTITYAVIGLVVALSAFIVLNIIGEFFGLKDQLLNFKVFYSP